MTVRIAQWTIDVQDVDRMTAFWSAALGFRVDQGDDEAAKLWPPDGTAPEVPTVWLQPSAGPKDGKNRNHLNLVVVPDEGNVDAEVARLLALGAQRADVGQTGQEQLGVLADPEGNEFCVLHHPPRRPGG